MAPEVGFTIKTEIDLSQHIIPNLRGTKLLQKVISFIPVVKNNFKILLQDIIMNAIGRD